MTTETETLAALVRGTFREETGEFRPCAFFDEPLDCIRVMTRDCSVTETRVSDLMTVLEDNYYDPGSGGKRFVGFTIKGAKHFCNARPRWTPQKRPLIDTSKPAISGMAAETGGVLPRGLRGAQVGLDLRAPAAWPALEDMAMMQ